MFNVLLNKYITLNNMINEYDNTTFKRVKSNTIKLDFIPNIKKKKSNNKQSNNKQSNTNEQSDNEQSDNEQSDNEQLETNEQSDNEQSDNEQSDNEQSDNEQSDNEQLETNEQLNNEQLNNEQSDNEQLETNEQLNNKQLNNKQSNNEQSDNEQSDNEQSDNEQSDNEQSDNEQSDNESDNSQQSDNEIHNTSDCLSNYIIKKIKYNNNAELGFIKWNGLHFINIWELQRSINNHHVKNIIQNMETNYKEKQKFNFYDPIHIALENNDYLVIDGQHRLEAYKILFNKNIYPIQNVPCIIWHIKTDKERLELFDTINQRTIFDKKKLFRYKIIDIMEDMNKYGNIWGCHRPKLDKELFIKKMELNNNVHKMESSEIIKKIIEINNNIRQLPRNKRCNTKCSTQVHIKAETIDFFLGYDKNMDWINTI